MRIAAASVKGAHLANGNALVLRAVLLASVGSHRSRAAPGSDIGAYFTSKPSARRHTLCASMTSAHAASPFITIHSSRTFFVSGHEQQIFLPDLPSFGAGLLASAAGGLLASPPIGTRHSSTSAASETSPCPYP